MKAASSWSVPNIVSSILFTKIILILFSSPQFCFARDNITEKSRLADGETLVSPGNVFELGFFSPSNISNVKRYVGIWYISNPKLLVWVANRENPVPDRIGVLYVADGTLKLSDGKGNLYWSQPGGKRSTPVMKLSDTCNLILLENRSKLYLWQSFEHPTDTFLSGMKMDPEFLLTSWSSKDDPSPGNFTFKLDPHSRSVLMEKSTIYWRSSRTNVSTSEVPSRTV
ncbi:G-type lectin S-receptor-like serine/threonine-protein kinase At4g03230 [Hibiscus syriacus]|uniref:G-type lectin S-receptor-like serine/threonine-protein kinase At4g03230 n=1 Tax=Hibiscus syriacus TaxID=106335 RepID=UPI001920B3F6|nr:G-type lectin S-receptor-like serine/threonine-protein kinase At4g03230 [Hibiscus syriacus]